MPKKEKFSLEKLKKTPKNQLLICGLCGVLLLVVAMPAGRQDGQKEQEAEGAQASEEETSETSAELYQKKLERELGQALGRMEGVGKVEVMITLQDEGERVVEKDLARTGQESLEQDGEAKREAKDYQVQEETVFAEGSGEGGAPFVSREAMPGVEGVLVVAEGGGDPKTAKNISDAVLALFPVELHKIKVVKMN